MKGLNVFVVGLTLLSSGWVHAQETEQSVQLDEIVVTSNRYAISDAEVPAYVTVIGSQEIERSNARTASDLLKGVPGVLVTDNGTAKSAIVDIRGSGGTAPSNVLVLVNSRKVNPVDISGPDWLQIPKDSIERIEIVRGAGTVLYGDNAVGGVVNIITKSGKGQKPSVKVGGKYGSYSSSLADLQVSGDKDRLSYYAYADYNDTDGYRTNSNELHKNFDSRFGYTVSPQLDLDVITTWHEDDYRLPSGLKASQIQSMGRRATRTPNDFASTKDRSIQLSATVSPSQEKDTGVFDVDYSFRNRDTFGFLDFGFGDTGATKRTIDTHGVTGKYTLDSQLGGKDLSLVTGVDYYRSKNDILANTFGSFVSSDDLTIAKTELAGYLSAEYEAVDRIYLNAGTRYQKAYYTFDQRASAVVYEKQNPDEQASMAGLRYQYAEKSNVYLNAQQTFRFLATDEWYSTFTGLDTSLRPQKGWQYEAGIKHNVDDILTLHATPYYITNRDEIFFDPVTVLFGSNRNYDRTTRVGLEVGQELDVLKLIEIPGLDQVEFYMNYTYQDPEFGKGAFKGKDIPMAPRHLANTGLKTAFFRNVHWSLNGNFVGSSFAINDTRNALPRVKPYFIADTRLSYECDNWDVFFGVNNLFDKKYFNYTIAQANGGTNSDYYPAPERNFNVGMDLRF